MTRSLASYVAAAAELIAPFEAIDSARLLAPVLDVLPRAPSRILDLGAGTGRDAAWLAGRGHRVTAVEPVAELREAGKTLHPASAITWVDDTLPDLAAVTGCFDCVLSIAVWHHLDLVQRARAMAAFYRITAPSGVLVLSLRHGIDVAGRHGFPCTPEETITMARGFALERRVQAHSVQTVNRANGVYWTWLALRRIG